ncbi:hypothetical protein MTO96_050404, partial [Rhipicephalus appendiculatus]
FHEHALYDLPAQIDYVLRNTGQRRLLYIGFSQGTLSFFTMMSEKPEYNDKVGDTCDSWADCNMFGTSSSTEL